MRYLTLIRHAKSSWDDSSLLDHERPLNQRGRANAPVAGEYIAKQMWPIEVIYSSHAVRALHTAELINKKLNIALESTKSLYSFNASQITHFIFNLSNRHESVAIVAHNPALTDVINLYCGQTINNLPTCGVAHIQFEADDWTKLEESKVDLLALYTPKKIII